MGNVESIDWLKWSLVFPGILVFLLLLACEPVPSHKERVPPDGLRILRLDGPGETFLSWGASLERIVVNLGGNAEVRCYEGNSLCDITGIRAAFGSARLPIQEFRIEVCERVLCGFVLSFAPAGKAALISEVTDLFGKPTPSSFQSLVSWKAGPVAARVHSGGYGLFQLMLAVDDNRLIHRSVLDEKKDEKAAAGLKVVTVAFIALVALMLIAAWAWKATPLASADQAATDEALLTNLEEALASEDVAAVQLAARAAIERLSQPNYTRDRKADAVAAYRQILGGLAAKPSLKPQALELGRLSYGIGRPKDAPNTYDEAAIANDIVAHS